MGRAVNKTILLAGVLGLMGCNRPCDAVLTAGEDDAQTATLVWESRRAESVTLTFSTPGDPTERTAAVVSSDGEHSASLWGLPPLSELTYTFSSDQKTCSDVTTAGNVPAGLPPVTVPIDFPENADDWSYIAGIAMGDTGTLFILDRQGQWRWHSIHDTAITVSSVELLDGVLYYNSFDQDRTNDIGQVHARPLRSTETTDTRTEGGHHTFARLPDGTIAFPSLDVRPWFSKDDGKEVDVVGDRILEVAPDGTVTELWSIWDHESPYIHDTWYSGFYGDLGQDWTHANALNYSEARGSYLLSLGHLDTIYEIDQATGEVLNRFTQDDVISGTVYNFQHDPNWTDDGTLLMISYPEEAPAMAIEYAVNDDGTLEEIWSFQRENNGTSLLGQARRLGNGNTFLNFGGIGEMREVTPDGNTIWQMSAGLGSWFGNVVLLDSLPEL